MFAYKYINFSYYLLSIPTEKYNKSILQFTYHVAIGVIMTLNQIRYFVTICKSGSITKAANELLVSQPSISSAIQLLEKELGLTLFDRKNQRLYLTTDGEAIYAQAEKILNDIEQLIIITKNLNHTNSKSTIYICASPVVSLMCHSPIFQTFSNRYLQIHLDIHEHGSLKSIELVSQHKADLAVIVLNDNIPDNLNIMPLIQTQVVYTVSAKHPMSTQQYINIEQIQNERFIIMDPKFYQSGVLVMERFSQANIKPSNYTVLNQIYLINKTIHESNVGAFLLEHFSKENHDTVGIPLSPALTVNIGLVWRKCSNIHTEVAKFIEFAHKSKNYFLTM